MISRRAAAPIPGFRGTVVCPSHFSKTGDAMRLAPTLALVGLLVLHADAQQADPRLPSTDDAVPDGLSSGDWTSIQAAAK